IEQNNHRLGSAARWSATACVRGRSGGCPKTEQRFRLEEARFVRAADGSSLGRRRLPADRIAVGQNLQRVRRRGVQIVSRDEVFPEIDVLSFEVASDEVRVRLLESQREALGRRPKVANGVRRVQFEIDAKMACGLGLIRVRAQRDGKVRLQILYRNRFVIFDLEALRSERGNWDDAGAKD